MTWQSSLGIWSCLRCSSHSSPCSPSIIALSLKQDMKIKRHNYMVIMVKYLSCLVTKVLHIPSINVFNMICCYVETKNNSFDGFLVRAETREQFFIHFPSDYLFKNQKPLTITNHIVDEIKVSLLTVIHLCRLFTNQSIFI